MIKEERETWSKLEYYLITLGSLIGFGCIWRFPYLLYENGGASFLIPYLFFMFFMSIPLVFLESGIG